MRNWAAQVGGLLCQRSLSSFFTPQFIRLAQTLKYYGYLKFDPCITDFPEKGCHVIVGAGNSELNFQVKLPNDQIKEGSFKVTRMRCWRVTSSVSKLMALLWSREALLSGASGSNLQVRQRTVFPSPAIESF